jgi:CBS domain containing-hemolysin-like protein
VNEPLLILLLIVAAIGSFLFSTLAYALRDYSRATLAEWFERRMHRDRDPDAPPSEAAEKRVEAVADYEDELALSAATLRTATNLIVVLCVVALVKAWLSGTDMWVIYLFAFGVAFLLIALFGVALPLAVSSHAAEPTIGIFTRVLRIKRAAMWPIIQVHGPIDRLVRRATGRSEDTPEHVEEELEKEILDIVREGSDEGVFGEAERNMIERAVRFHDMTVEQAMTPRGDVIGLPQTATADEVLSVIEESGFSRIPVYNETIDDVTGVLYARDLFRYVGKRLNGHDSDEEQTRAFRLPDVTRKPLVVPESKPLDDLLKDMQLQKIHMAIVLDEYGGTSGLITIEDVLEELVGDIVDEHDEAEDAMFRRISDDVAEVDARIDIDALNRLMNLHLPEDAEFETLGGYVTTTLGHIPSIGTSFERPTDHGRIVFTVVDAEPQRVNRLRLQRAPEPVAEPET